MAYSIGNEFRLPAAAIHDPMAPMDQPRHPDESRPDILARPVRDEDEPFLKALREENLSEKLLLDYTTLEEEEKRLLIGIQRTAQEKSLHSADWDKMQCLIEFRGEPAGVFWTFQDSEEILLADIVISSKFRNLGIGFAIIQSVQMESMQSKRPLRLHVEKENPAFHLYERMGFRPIEDRGFHLFMEWTPPNMQGKTLYFPGNP